jgi:hypothetical protein
LVTKVQPGNKARQGPKVRRDSEEVVVNKALLGSRVPVELMVFKELAATKVPVVLRGALALKVRPAYRALSVRRELPVCKASKVPPVQRVDKVRPGHKVLRASRERLALKA